MIAVSKAIFVCQCVWFVEDILLSLNKPRFDHSRNVDGHKANLEVHDVTWFYVMYDFFVVLLW